MSRFIMAINAEKCINGKVCILACRQRNNVPLEYSRNWVRNTPNSQIASRVSFQPGACMHCDEPLCVYACPTGATYKSADGTVNIDKDRCIGCGSCIKACPYQARHKNYYTGTADKCDYCGANLHKGGVPACVSVCTTKCRVFGDADDPNSDVAKALAAAKNKVYITAENCDTKPSLTYISETMPTDWAKPAEAPLPMRLMHIVGQGVKWTAGAALFGVIAVFVKQLFLPSDREHGEHNEQGGHGSENHQERGSHHD